MRGSPRLPSARGSTSCAEPLLRRQPDLLGVLVGAGSGAQVDLGDLTFVEETKEFVCNLATWDLREKMNQTSAPYPRGVNEMEAAGLTAAPCRLVRPPRVAESPCALECRYLQTVPLHDENGNALNGWVVIGRVIGVHIDERFIKNGLLDTAAMRPIQRCGYHDYAVVTETFTMVRPTKVEPTTAETVREVEKAR